MGNVLILSKWNDVSTDLVMEWLTAQGKEVFRLNNEDILESVNLTLNNLEYEVCLNGFKISEFTSIWVRKGQLPAYEITSKSQEVEFSILKNAILKLIEGKDNCLGTITKELEHNKLIDLALARECGLNIPRTWVINKKQELQKLLEEYELLVKPLADYHVESSENERYKLDLFELDNADNIEEKFFVSLVQEKVQKQFEIRVFFMEDKFYSIAIFSQSNEKTKLSFKDGSYDNLNRMVPFKLPAELEIKLKKMMRKKNINTGSIDIIYGTDDKFYFLEVNPAGQFNWVSEIGNYNIEKQIAEKLCQN